MSDPRTFGVDDGYYKGPVKTHNYQALADSPKNPKFILFCFGSGLWKEPEATWLVAQAEQHGWRWGAWYFAYAHLSPKAQVDLWMTQPMSPHFPACYDYEFSRSKKTIPSASQLKEAVERMEQKEGRAGMVYSRKNLVDAHLKALSPTWLNQRWWWLAQYLAAQEIRGEHPGPPDLPDRLMRERVIVHQTADRLPPPAGFYPSAHTMDHNRWCGTMTFESFFNPTAPPPLTLEQRVARLEAMHPHG